jgi:cyclopropane-fatty-acyl-phospholipid synthase
MTIADLISTVTDGDVPMRIEASDGSVIGSSDRDITLRLHTERALRYLITAPGDLGLARAYVTGELELVGAHPGDPYVALQALADWQFRRPAVAELPSIAQELGLRRLLPPKPPTIEAPSRVRRVLNGLRHSRRRDEQAIGMHYDVSNTFYEYVLGHSMAYTCAVFDSPKTSLDDAQYAKFDLVARKLGLRPGMRLLDVGCGWGGMARHAAEHYGVEVVAVTLSEQQARWAAEATERAGLADRVRIIHGDYRDSPGSGYDAVSSIGLLEHVGVANYPAYFTLLRDKLRPGGRLLNHCITRPDNRTSPMPGAFIDRYVFPDGELVPLATTVEALEGAGFEVRDVESLREHYALTLREWVANLERCWDEAARLTSPARARIWRLYMAGSALAFEANRIGVNQVLAVKPGPRGASGMARTRTYA